MDELVQDAPLVEVTANKMYEPAPLSWQMSRRFLVFEHAVSWQVAMNHLRFNDPMGVVVRAIRGPKGGWIRASYTSTPVPPSSPGKAYQWFIAVREVPRKTQKISD